MAQVVGSIRNQQAWDIHRQPEIGSQLDLTINSCAQTEKPISNLTFTITGFADDSGQVLVQLFHKEDKIPLQTHFTFGYANF
jgi:hypothetical protein